MDIQFAYNMERMLYYVMGEDAECTRSYMAALEADRRCQLPPEALRRVQQVFHSVSVDDAATLGTMKRVWDESGYCLDVRIVLRVRVRARLLQPLSLRPRD